MLPKSTAHNGLLSLFEKEKFNGDLRQTPSLAENFPMRSKSLNLWKTVLSLLGSTTLGALGTTAEVSVNSQPGSTQRLLYVAEPGIRNYLEYGGHGLLVFDMDHGHRFVKRIPTAGLDAKGAPLNVKGICASPRTKRLYTSTIKQVMCLALVSEKLLWEKA